MHKLAFKKLLKNKWLFLSLTAAIFLCVTSACVLPMFSTALVGRLLSMSFSDNTANTGEYADKCSFTAVVSQTKSLKSEQDRFYSDLIERKLVPQLLQTTAFLNKYYISKNYDLTDVTYGSSDNQANGMLFIGINNFPNNFKLMIGKYPSEALSSDGVLEVMVSNDAAILQHLAVNRVYTAELSSGSGKDENIRVKIVGIFAPVFGGASSIAKNQTDNLLVCGTDGFEKVFLAKDSLSSITWDYFLNYHSLDTNRIDKVLKAADNVSYLCARNGVTFSYTGTSTLKQFTGSRKSLGIMNLLFSVPMFLLLLFCIFFISKLVIETDKNEIAVFQSRGASFKDITALYLMQDAVLVLFSFLSAPFAAVFLCMRLSNFTGFLQVGPNIPLLPKLSWTVFLYDILACLLIILIMLIPCLSEMRKSIVERKHVNAVRPPQPFWKRFYLDFLLLAVSCYGYYNFSTRQKAVVQLKAGENTLPVEPLSFLVVFLFLFSMGLIFMRFYPSLIRLAAKAGGKLWNASAYYSLRRVTVLGGKEQFVILYIILTVGIGIFSANAARTINQNLDDMMLYDGGADVVIKTNPVMENGGTVESRPPDGCFTDIPGVSAVSVVDKADNVQIYAKRNQSSDPIQMIGVDTISFSRTAWSRSDMNLCQSLNQLSRTGNSCLISKTLADKMNLNVGDTIGVNMNEKNFGGYDLIVRGIVTRWPGYSYETDSGGALHLGDMILSNAEFLEKNYRNVSYEVWLKTAKNLPSSVIAAEMDKKHIALKSIDNFRNNVYLSENSAERQSVNALLTLTFLVVFAVCLIGFLVYWVLSVISRVRQFGTLRAMGMSAKSVNAVLALEQILISAASAAYAILIGGFASRVFMNVLKITFGAGQQMIPFRFLSSRADFLKIYLFLAFLFLAAFAAILYLVKRIRVSQIIKLGED